MFEGEQLEDGITLRVYRFKSPATGKPTVSFVVRMQGEKTDLGSKVFNPVIEAEKAEAKLKLDEHAKVKPWNPLARDAQKAWQKTANELSAKYSNPLFDYDALAAEALIADWSAQLKELGLTKTVASRKSNGDLDEEILTWK